MTTQEIREYKASLRAKFKQVRNSCDNRPQKSASITEKLLSSMSYKYCNDILLYFSKGDEVDTSAIFEKAISDGKNVYFPKTYANGIMKFFKISSLSELIPAKFGLNEPDGTTSEYDGSCSTGLCIVPGLCFDRFGFRIGYGKGYYDRFLSSFKGIAAGLAYSDCITNEKITIEKRYDKPVDIIFSESEVILIGSK